MLNFLQGKKTYIVVVLGLVVLILQNYGILDESATTVILTALGLGGLATLRLAIRGYEREQ